MTGEASLTPLSRRAVLGSVAAAIAGATGGAAAQRTHTVDMTDDLVFDPDAITIAAGDTVVWENVGRIGHTVTAYEDEIPAGAEYFASGGFESEQAARDAYPGGDVPGGASYEHRFAVPGPYEYFCVPHEGAGMTGTVEVAPSEGGRTPGDGEPVLPRSPLTSAILVGTVVVAAVVTLYQVFGKGME